MLNLRPAGPDTWPDVAAVMGERGDPSRCFCQYFRLRGKAWSDSSPADNREGLKQQVCTSEQPPGVLAYDGSTPIGWCAVAPRTAYPRVVASPNWRTDHPDAWVITCFVVPVGHRRQGVAAELLYGAVDLARSYGASTVEACAVDTTATGRISSADLYRGPLSVYLSAGFTEVSRTSPQWVLVRSAVQ
ncbi:GNAT family N-acetyltransferase [Kribbella jiaozuonensis]|uniref:GNAT family N-acetyltransferase n=1 Tax=Kribbella jiaozuonensis TaxID=2575441 RepID=A0A4U3LFX9_9ACTN|nr:GNAT family N-acetyltransferase [Kribbella jiaozuonensis]TKK74321.1 GNAT family N-acetyltransferase [Kribbella jiaozuonensis]